MKVYERDGWRLAFEEVGSGPPVLLLHGLLMNHSMFDPQVEALGNRYRFLLPDARGHGASEHRAEPYSQWDLMEDARALLDHLGVDRAVWGGVSQGGFQALRAALRHPDRVAGLILIDTSAGPEDEFKAPMYEAFAEVVASEGWNQEILDVATTSMFGASVDLNLKQRWMQAWLAEGTDDERERLASVTRREDLTDRLGEIHAPAMVIHGEEDVAIPMTRAEELAAGLPGTVKLVRIPGAGHSSTIERPEPVTEAIERFLASVYGSSGPPS